MNTGRKKLIEVAIPLEEINRASIREKSIRHGHPSTLHLWWARRPLAACRAVLFAQLVDDPSSHPDRFPTEQDQERERARLFNLMAELVTWENSTNEDVLARAHAEILTSCDGELPPVYDPFSGGGSIPLEAQRLGLPAHGSDLNPVAVTIGKAMIEIPPLFAGRPPVNPDARSQDDRLRSWRHAEGLAEDVRYYGQWMRERAFERIGHLYPEIDLPAHQGGGRATVIAWIWARTVPSPDPAFADADVPLVASFMLSSKKGKECWLHPVVDSKAKTISFEVCSEGSDEEKQEAKKGTKTGRGANFRCLYSGAAISPDHVKKQGMLGNMKAKLMAIVVEGQTGRIYLPPDDHHEELARLAKPPVISTINLSKDLRAFWTPAYGLSSFSDLFTDRQLVALTTFSDLVHEARDLIEKDALRAGLDDGGVPLRDGGASAKAYAEAVSVYLAFGVSRLADIQNSLCPWSTPANQVVHLFGRQAIPMVWHFGEGGLFSGAAGDFGVSIGTILKVLRRLRPCASGVLNQHDAQTIEYPRSKLISTDPPYYDNVGYADLSDFFHVWLRPALAPVYPELFSVLATPKHEELVAKPHLHGGKQQAEDFFLTGMRDTLANMVRQTDGAFPTTIFYAFKQSEVRAGELNSPGWATFLQAVIDSGFSVVATWPMRTERPIGLKQKANALANSVVLVCRKRPPDAGYITRAEFIQRLAHELPDALRVMQQGNIAPADLPQAAIGPGIGIFSQYDRILERDDSPMSVKTALDLINAKRQELMSGEEGDLDAETRFAMAWFELHGMGEGPFGEANIMAQGNGIAVDDLVHAGIGRSSRGRFRLLARDEMDAGWRPDRDGHLTVWECVQHLIRQHDSGGEQAAARLLKQLGSAEADAANKLAYRLYETAANIRGEAKEGHSYNNLVAIWSHLRLLAGSMSDAEAEGDPQERLL